MASSSVLKIEIDSESLENAKRQILEIAKLAQEVEDIISRSWLLRLIFGLKLEQTKVEDDEDCRGRLR